MATTPFKFLDSYTKEDQEIFFGRDKEIEELHYKIFESNLLVVYGSSGTGKTSLIQCGLASKFNDADWMPIIIRRGNNINDSLKRSLQSIALTPLKKNNRLPQDIRSIYLDHFKPMIILFDQFEELFIFGTEEEMDELLINLKACLEANLSCRFIFVLRGEYLENITRFEDLIPEFFNNRMRIERMTRKNAVHAISGPAALFNISVSDDFPSMVLEKLSQGKGSVELTYLQVYLDKLYKKAVAKDPLRVEFNELLLQQSGRIDDVLAEFLEEQIAKTTSPEQAMAILKAFVSNEGTKRQMNVKDVQDFTLAMGKKISSEEIEKYIRQFVDLRILKDKDENEKYEFRHDALAKKIFDQVSYSEKELIEVRQFIINRYNDFKKRGDFLQEQDISYILPYENKMFLNPEQKEFVYKSIKVSRLKKRRVRNTIIFSTILLILVLAGFTIFAVLQRNKAYLQSKIADQKTLEALNQKELAEKANRQSIEAARKALDAKTFAELQKTIADSQSSIANQQKLRATEQSEIARQQKTRAEQEAENAKKQTELAQNEKMMADQEKEKALAAEAEANRLRMVSLSQTVAFKSIQVKSNPQLAALLSNEAYKLAKDNMGNVEDPQIYSALCQSLKNFGADNYPAITSVPAEIKAMGVSTEGIITAILANGALAHYYSSGKPATSAALDGGPVNTAYLSSDCKFAVTNYDDFTVRILNTSTGSVSPALTGHTDFVRAAAFSNDGRIVLTGGRDSSVIIWTSNHAQMQVKFPSRIKALELTGNNSNILAGCEDGLVYQYNISSGNMVAVINNSPARIQCIARSSLGKFIIVASSGGQLNILNVDGQLIKTFSEGRSVDFVSASDESGMLAEATGNHMIRIYNLNDLSQKPIEISDVKTTIKGLALSKQDMLSIACGNNTIREYSLRSGVIQNLVAGKITRSFTEEEWNAYIGKDVPYKK